MGRHKKEGFQFDGEFALALKALRSKLGINQIEFAARVGIPRHALVELESKLRRSAYETYVSRLVGAFPELVKYKTPPDQVFEDLITRTVEHQNQEKEKANGTHAAIPAPTPTPSSELVSGLLVQLRSGSPTMIIESTEEGWASVVWFDGAASRRDKFLITNLEPVPS